MSCGWEGQERHKQVQRQLLRDTHSLTLSCFPLPRAPKGPSAAEGAVKTILLKKQTLVWSYSSSCNSLQLLWPPLYHTCGPDRCVATSGTVAMEVFTRHIQRSCSQFPLTPFKIPPALQSYFAGQEFGLN